MGVRSSITPTLSSKGIHAVFSVETRCGIRTQILEYKEAAVYNPLPALSMMIPVSVLPRILAFDTSTQRGSVALLEGREIRADLRLQSLQTHSTLLLSSIQFLLCRLNWTLNDLNLVAVGIGPGSFTGIRIGIATALGISQSLSIPFAGISGLEALAHQAAMLSGCIGVVLNAHREQVFYAEYVCNKGKLRRSAKPALMNISDLERHLAKRHLYIVGDWEGRLLQGTVKSPPGWPRAIPADLFLASGIGRLACSRKNRWRSGEFLLLEPTYIRPPDALRNKNRQR
jgi:tRNA threonylcarbamoyladenosine biosynthesis protein TsaB